jgi:hypothetical protein
VLLVYNGIFPDKLQLDQLQQLLGIGYSIKRSTKIRQCLVMVDGRESGEGISLAGRVAFCLQESRDELCCVGDERGRMLENGRHSKDGVLADICVAVLETRSGRGEEGLDKLGLTELAQEAECVAPDVFVGMLKVIPDAVAGGLNVSRLPSLSVLLASGHTPDQDHLLLQLPLGIQLRTYLVVKV